MYINEFWSECRNIYYSALGELLFDHIEGAL